MVWIGLLRPRSRAVGEVAAIETTLAAAEQVCRFRSGHGKIEFQRLIHKTVSTSTHADVHMLAVRVQTTAVDMGDVGARLVGRFGPEVQG